MKKWIWVLGITIIFSGMVFAETIAYRQNTTLYVLPDGEGPAIYVGRVTGNYKVGNNVVVFNDGSRLYAASLLSAWQPVFIARNVQSFHVTPNNMVLFRSSGDLYRATADGYERIAENIRDYETINSKIIVRPSS